MIEHLVVVGRVESLPLERVRLSNHTLRLAILGAIISHSAITLETEGLEDRVILEELVSQGLRRQHQMWVLHYVDLVKQSDVLFLQRWAFGLEILHILNLGNLQHV